MAPATYFVNLLDFVQNDVPFVVTNLEKASQTNVFFFCIFSFLAAFTQPILLVLSSLQHLHLIVQLRINFLRRKLFVENYADFLFSKPLPSPHLLLWGPFFRLSTCLLTWAKLQRFINEIVESLYKFEDGILVDRVFAVWARPIIYLQPKWRHICWKCVVWKTWAQMLCFVPKRRRQVENGAEDCSFQMKRGT